MLSRSNDDIQSFVSVQIKRNFYLHNLLTGYSDGSASSLVLRRLLNAVYPKHHVFAVDGHFQRHHIYSIPVEEWFVRTALYKTVVA